MFSTECGPKHFSERIKSAMSSGDLRTIIILLEGCHPTEIKDHEDSTLLHLAVQIGNWSIVDFLIHIGCDINAQNQMGTTPLLAALEAFHFPIMDSLLRAKANIFISDNKGMNVLKMLFKFDEGINRQIFIGFIIKSIRECGINAKELASIMMEAGWSLHYAMYIQNREVIKFMLEAGCDINSRNTNYHTPLHTAILNNDVETTKMFLEYGANVDITGEGLKSPFELAITNSRVKIFETFLKHKPTLDRFNTDEAKECFAFFSDASGHIIRLLFDYKVNLTTKDKCGVTLLHYLVLNSNREVINLIMKSEIDVNIKDIYGNTPLHCAVGFSNIECIKALINKGADVNAKNVDGDTPLINAMYAHAEQQEIDLYIENSILDEEMQSILLNLIKLTNIPISYVRSLLKRLAIMHFQVEALSRRNLELIQNNSSINFIFELYLCELNSMKQNYIIDSRNISVLDVLCASEQKLLNLARNKEMVDNFLKIDVDSKYQIFGEFVKKRFESACFEQSLIQNAVNVLTENIKQLNFNLEVTENIIKFLSTDDLVTFYVCECY